MRYAERTPENRLDGKPIGKPPDRRGEKSVMQRTHENTAAAHRGRGADHADGKRKIRLIFLLHRGRLTLFRVSARVL